MSLPNSLNETFKEINIITEFWKIPYSKLKNETRKEILEKIIFIIWVNNIFIEDEVFKNKISLYKWLETDIKANIDTSLYKVDTKEGEIVINKNHTEIAKEILFRRFYVEWNIKWYDWGEKNIIDKVINDYLTRLEKEDKIKHNREEFLNLIIIWKLDIDAIWKRTLEKYKKSSIERDSISLIIWDINDFSQKFYEMVDKDENIIFWEKITNESYSMEIIGIKEKIRIFKNNNKDLALNLYQTIDSIEWLINSLKEYIYATNTEISNFLIPLKKIRELIDSLTKEMY